MRRRLGVPTDPELRLRQDGQRLTVEVVEQPRLAHEQRARVLVTPGVDFRFRALDDQKCVGIGVAPCGCQQGLGGMPGTP